MRSSDAAVVHTNIRKDTSQRVVMIVSVIFVTLFSLTCIIPFICMISASFTSQRYITEHGYSLLPHNLDLTAYRFIFVQPQKVLNDYILTIVLTAAGTAIGLFITAMTGYALQRPDFRFRNGISFYIYFTTLFSGGLIPFYLLIVNYLHLKYNYMAVLLPSLMSPWLIIMMKSFLKTLPHAMTESAKIDGAGDFKIFLSIILPCATPALATIGLFIALGYWNEWYNALLFLDPNNQPIPLQLFLYNVVTKSDFLKYGQAAANVPAQNLPSETLKMAVAVITTGPVILFYPFVQKYFIKGITIGAVKG